uniref:Valine--tRNA ligase, mitochondrial n=1 Tax=Pygocentrus nattereri TaxID=42514 RepID=A0AAR2KAG6_PYGNA
SHSVFENTRTDIIITLTFNNILIIFMSVLTSYSPEYVESCWYPWWEKQGFFRPEKHNELPQAVDRIFSLCIPPPNVTGTLHLGHALTVAIEDALARWRRMQGYKVLWVPGCDHAGIATQSVVERRLLREQDKRRQDYSREEFLQEVWRWKQEKGDEIYHQLKKLGASLDWSRACFTMDPRGVSNMEFGTMITFAYPIEGHEGEVAVSTTRPETMLGDVAIAVHPDDTRYQALHGKQCRHPFTNRLLPIITDPVVDMGLGTGAVKLTPAHDHTDFLLSQRHSLPRLTVIGGDGTMTSHCGHWLQGVKRFQARERVISALMEMKLFRGKEDHPMSLPICSRSGDVIEPLLKKQWFVRCEKMAQKAIQAVDEGELEIIPHFYTKTWKNWLSNISDWCISRQLWWGHQIPAYRVTLPESGNTQEVGLAEIREIIGSFVQLEHSYQLKGPCLRKRNPDVLDTWFSSGLFPFAMLGWPEQTEDLKQFYPNTMLETGNDLIFFWVARMVMLGTELTGQLPFKQVLFHSLVRDKHGRKMSKSLGNVIDPLDVISGVSLERLQEKVMEGNLDPREKAVAMEAQRKDFPNGIPECGTDALRFALCSYKAQGEDISLSVSQVLSCRHFCNKMWQTVRFTLGALLDVGSPVTPLPEVEIDKWICSCLYSTVEQCERGFESYELHTVTSALHSFWLHSLCDVYLVSLVHIKVEKRVAAAVLYHCVSTSLRLLSPLMPFLTEELWQRLQPYSPRPSTASSSVCMQSYPTTSELAHWHFPQDEADFPLVQEVVRVARSLRAQYHLTKEKPDSECHDCVCLTCSGIFFSLLLFGHSIQLHLDIQVTNSCNLSNIGVLEIHTELNHHTIITFRL